ncbi:unnamed protein product [Fusarium graminearum]|nr:unnamed protein product [Fusarium graminearum]
MVAHDEEAYALLDEHDLCSEDSSVRDDRALSSAYTAPFSHRFKRPCVVRWVVALILVSLVSPFGAIIYHALEQSSETGQDTTLGYRLHAQEHTSRPPKTLIYNWNITAGFRSPDGVEKRVYLINGPIIEARSSDTVVVHVHNGLSQEGLSIHWHGLRMKNQNGMDGAVGFTQSPILPGDSFNYTFTIGDDEYGTFWWHSHSDVQRADGLWGGLVVHSPDESNQQPEDYLIMIGDWFHRNQTEVLSWFADASSRGNEPVPDSLLVNGQGRFDCSMAVPARPVVCSQVTMNELKPLFRQTNDRRARIRVVNTGSIAGLTIRIDAAMMRPVRVDGGFDVHSEATEAVGILYPGERVDIDVEWKDDHAPNRWLTVYMDEENFGYPNEVLNPVQDFPIFDHGNKIPSRKNQESNETQVLDPQNLKAAAKIVDIPSVADHTILLYAKIEKLAHMDYEPVGFINHTSWKPQYPPLISQNRSSWDDNQLIPFITTSREKPTRVDIIINNLDDGAHPFHLHGHSFYVLSSYRDEGRGGWGSYNPYSEEAPPNGLDLDFPLRLCHVNKAGFIKTPRFEMDPITAFQVAGTVITFIEFSYNLISETRSAYKSPDGYPKVVNDLSTVINDLADVSHRIRHVIDVSVSQANNASDNTLIRLCRESQDIAGEMNSALLSLQAKGTSKLGQAKSSVIVALKAMWSKDKLAKLEQRLQQIRSEMTMAMLVVLWEKERRRDDKGDSELKNQIEEISKAVNRNNGMLDDFLRELDATASDDDKLGPVRRQRLLSRLWDAEWQPSDVHLHETSQISETRTRLHENIQNQIIRSLHFPGIEARERLIPEPYAKTYQWIYRDEMRYKQASTTMRVQSLPQWLQDSTNKVYWITGKPGSGKSTLMNFVIHNPLTKQYLKDWAAPFPLVQAQFYFWEAGQSSMQRSQQGMMQTLLWQCLRQKPDLIPRVTPRRWMVHQVLRGLETPAPPWTWEELRTAFTIIASQNDHSFKLVLFLDGLDEFAGDPAVVVSFVKDLVASYGVKICVGSRPWTDFADAFDQYPMLIMQSQTRNDISEYITGKFEACRAFRERKAVFPDQAKRLLQDISNKAQGVFLWVFLVVRDLIHSLSRGRSLSDLQMIVDDLPTDLEALYTKMRERVEPKDMENSARYYQLIVSALKPLHMVTIWMIDGEALPDGDTFTKEMEDNIRKILQRRLDSSTKGLLELDDNGFINFLHRTARDWVIQGSQSAQFKAQAPPSFDPNLALVQVLTKQLPHEKIYQHIGHSHISFWSFAVLGFLYAGQVGSSPHTDHLLIQAIEEFDAALCQRATYLGNKGFVFTSNTIKPQPGVVDTRLADKTHPWYFFGRRNREDMTPPDPCFDHWTCTQYGASNFLFTHSTILGTIGIAAQFGIVPYVLEMMRRDKNLLKGGALSALLQDSLFGWQLYKYRTYEDVSEFYNIDEQAQERMENQRIGILMTILGHGKSLYTPCYDALALIEKLDNAFKIRIGSKSYWEKATMILDTSMRRRGSKKK